MQIGEEVCTKACAGVLVWRKERTELLIAKWRKFPFWNSIPTCHIELDANPIAMGRQGLRELTGLEVKEAYMKKVYQAKHHNAPCHLGDNVHEWTVFEAEVGDGSQPEKRLSSTLSIRWVSLHELSLLAQKTLQRLRGGAQQSHWADYPEPGLDPVVYRILKSIGTL